MHADGRARHNPAPHPDGRLGPLVRKRNEGDRRVVIAVATKRELQLLLPIEQPWQELQRQRFALLSNRELEVLVSGLEMIPRGMARSRV